MFFVETLVEQAKRLRAIMDNEQPEKLLSLKQLDVFELFKMREVLDVLEIFMLLKGTVPAVTIKQALSRLVELNLVERIGGQGD